MPKCEKCHCEKTVKSGFVRGKQRYKCEEYGYNSVEGGARTNERIVAKKAMCVLLYTLSKALDCSRRRTVAWVLGSRDSKTFKRLYDKVKHLEDCIFHTDSWSAFTEILPPGRRVIGKSSA